MVDDVGEVGSCFAAAGGARDEQARIRSVVGAVDERDCS